MVGLEKEGSESSIIFPAGEAANVDKRWYCK